MDTLLLLLVIALACVALYVYWKFFKLYKVKNIVFIDGSLGTCKSFLSVSLGVRLYKNALRIYKLKKVLYGFLAFTLPTVWKPKLEALEEPRLYSNIKLRNVPFVKLTRDLLFRKQRFAYKSVVLIDEFSLLADQFCYKDREMSERLSLFFKLFRHETMGGYCVINSQSTSDLHYSLKYVLSDYLYIHHKTKWPFVMSLKVQEMVYCADKDGGNVVNARNEDIEETCKTMLVPKRYFRYYDCYCYSVFTDSCPVYCLTDVYKKKESLKDANLVSFKTFAYLYENLPKESRPKGVS